MDCFDPILVIDRINFLYVYYITYSCITFVPQLFLPLSPRIKAKSFAAINCSSISISWQIIAVILYNKLSHCLDAGLSSYSRNAWVNSPFQFRCAPAADKLISLLGESTGPRLLSGGGGCCTILYVNKTSQLHKWTILNMFQNDGSPDASIFWGEGQQSICRSAFKCKFTCEIKTYTETTLQPMPCYRRIH